ncbi:MAG: DUF11 domain-containing protein [Candidatus Kerfeldbacteria bacterium]|nr:DUF11 domain-containing protein [Candidatus Kerfeldbacteria bacterium]
MAKKRSSSAAAKRPRKVQVQPEAGDASAIIDEIYAHETERQDGSLKTIERSTKARLPKRWLVSLGIFAMLATAALAGFFTFNRTRHFDQQGVTIKIETPSSVTSAGTSTLNLTVTNGESVGIRNVEISLAAPEGWVYTSSQPESDDPNHSLWQLGSIGAGVRQSVVLTGSLTGEVGSVKTFNATVTYRPANFNYDFSAKASGSVTIGSSIVDLKLVGPTQASPGSTATYTLTYTNTSADALQNLRLVATYPEEFTTKALEPKPREGNSLWVVNELPSGGTGTLKVEGTFGGAAGESVELSFAAELQRGSATERQVETSLVVLMVSTALDVKLNVNGQESNGTARPGETLKYELAYKNATDVEVKNVVVTVELSGGGFDAKSFSDDYGVTLDKGRASWDVKRVPELASLKPGAAGTIRFSIKVLEAPAETKGEGGSTVVAAVSLALGADGNTNLAEQVKLPPLIVKVVSAVTMTVEGRYYNESGQAIGSGPLPPTVGQATSYRLFWYVGNATNELKDVTISAVVPSHVTWTGRGISTTAGTLTFDASTRTIAWTLNRLPKGAASTARAIAAQAELSVTPTADDLGSIMILLEQSKLTATDSFTGTKVEAVRDRVTTDLSSDANAAGRGAVVAG